MKQNDEMGIKPPASLTTALGRIASLSVGSAVVAELSSVTSSCLVAAASSS